MFVSGTNWRSPKTVKSAAFTSWSNDLSDIHRHKPSGAKLMHQPSYQWHMFLQPQQELRGTINNSKKLLRFGWEFGSYLTQSIWHLVQESSQIWYETNLHKLNIKKGSWSRENGHLFHCGFVVWIKYLEKMVKTSTGLQRPLVASGIRHTTTCSDKRFHLFILPSYLLW